ncbi:MAG: rRNA pseudouridine synthase [Taibaiella sp.]|nr:rRNA pseudouridine synthase [Taibaiella sp.]
MDRGEVEKIDKEDRKPIEFEAVELENRFETKSDKKPSFERKERRNDRDERNSRHDRKDDKQAAFLEHFDYENPNEMAYDTRGNRGVRTEQQQSGNDEIMPLNKFIAHSGVCSRRDAVELIKNGKIAINGKIATEPGYKVQPEDVIQMDGKPLKVQKNLVYVLLNKPKGFITTTDDPKGRRTVMDIFGDNIKERVFPVGRLDRNTTGLLLLTNDGEVAQQLSHPKYENRKIYQVTLDRNVAKADFEQIIKGLELEDGVTQVDQLAYLEKKNEIGIEIHSGKNRIVRRIFEHLGYEVEKLDRVMYAGLTKKNLKRGQWRFLTKQEVINLKHLKR